MKAYVIIGAHERCGDSLYNTMLFLSNNGSSYYVHRKLTPTFTERLVWGQGDGSTLTTITTEYGRIGGLICWEHWLPLARAAMHSMHEIVHVAQWPGVGEMHQIASRHYAFEGQCYVLAAGTVLRKSEVLNGFDSLPSPVPEARTLLEHIPDNDNQLLQHGGSSIIAPNGTYVVEPVYESETILYAELDPDKVLEGKMHLDTDGHYSRPDVFHLTVNTTPLWNVEFRKKD